MGLVKINDLDGKSAFIHPTAVAAITRPPHRDATWSKIHLTTGGSIELHWPSDDLAIDLGIAPVTAVRYNHTEAKPGTP